MAKQQIMFKAPFADFSGYATAARNLLLELYKSDRFDLYLEPIVWINSGNLNLPEEDQKIIDDLLAKSKGLTVDSVTSMTLLHFTIATEFIGKQNSPFKRNIGYTMLETDKVTPMWAQKCNMMDAIFTPSPFCLSSFMQSGITVPIRIVPLGTDPEKFKPEGEKLLNFPTKYNFLSVGQWLLQGDRKNMVGVIRTFHSIFKDNKDVGLIIKSYHESAGTRDKLAITNSIQSLRNEAGLKPGDGPQVYLIHGAMSEENIIKLYRNADCFLMPTAGEAWGMPLLEAATMGIPCITTGGTGSEAFLNPEFTILLDYNWQPIGDMLRWPGVYEPHLKLAIPDMEEFSRMVNRVYKNQKITKEQGELQRKEILERDFSWKAAAKCLADTLDELDEDLDLDEDNIGQIDLDLRKVTDGKELQVQVN